ncbi:MBL fold metallo-hydrolase [Clostridium botulinum]|uniref:ComEC/Rec2 family competence protein n=1 Tax=Clostridium botulinum TaxID=1491 RepID=UPI001A92D868|nr:MBL fold metallo-hydrolase [Clostridium botulinum]MBO0525087.1 MBL fold metallo-hydrolase [Clostridium botulinum]MBO0527673.1 MBL fold metallo-hydrolase [Clostridium botulinum]MBO0532937.1 MBL fold metallo-hydrolase [Clostridium botulinum]MBO0537012.1 MBL fold metallo-hydrolase [Clostridium botulinum]MBO0537404.1 MBL fold metallo-hydrolase [Clostridium botulinum]
MKIKAPRTFLVFIVVVSLFSIKAFAKDRSPEVHFIDTGQSDCILIKTGKENYLIDTGWEYYSGKILSYLNSNNVDKIDGVILTHYHDDHYGGLEMLLKTSKVKKIFLPKHDGGDKKKVINMVKKHKIKYEWIEDGWEVKGKKLNLKAIAPMNIDGKNENNNSIVLFGKIDGIKYLFLGDCEQKEEKDMIYNEKIKKCDVLKVSHHGFKTSNSDELIDMAKPKIAIVTCDGIYSPDKIVIDRLKNKDIEVLTTSNKGNLIIRNQEIIWNRYSYYINKGKNFIGNTYLKFIS